MCDLWSWWRVTFLILYLNCAEYMVWSEQRPFFENKFDRIDQEQTITGDSETRYQTEIMEECVIRCSQDPGCKAYQYRDNETYNCILIRGTRNETTGNTYSADQQSTIYKRNFCFPNPCSTRRPRCLNGDDSYSCECPLGWLGEDCDERDPCYPSPCKHNAECSPRPDNYTCDCPVGFTGKDCEVNIDDCPAVNPCQNGGRCADLINGYECQCSAGYNGTLCETDINECSSAPCLSGGTCEDAPGSYLCRCLTGFEGDNCENDIDDCAGITCSGQGTCEDGINSYTCDCVTGYTGNDCENDIDDCTGITCSGQGTCEDDINSYTCNCNPGYTGSDCESDIDECLLTATPCQNGGTCQDGVNQHTCDCADGFTGQECESEISSAGCSAGEWCAPAGWTASQPAEYLTLDTDDGSITLHGSMGGATITTGLIGNAIETDDESNSQYAEITGLTACIIADPDSCGSTGATVTAWIKVLDCASGTNGIISSQTGFTASKGFYISCLNDKMRYAVYGANGYFEFTTNTNEYTLNDWMHVALVFNGPADNGMEGISVYQDGASIADITARSSPGSATAPSGAVMIGRQLNSQHYASVIVDELIFWDEKLQPTEVEDVFDMHNPNP